MKKNHFACGGIIQRGLSSFAWWIASCLLGCLSIAAVNAAPPAPRFRTDRILILPKADQNSESLSKKHAAKGVSVLREFHDLGRLQVLKLPDGTEVRQAIRDYLASGLVEYAEPDYFLHASVEPNDPSYTNGTQWGLKNTGQLGGRAGIDISAPDGWDITHDASTVVVAIIDSGVRYTHQDLASNMWTYTKIIRGTSVNVHGTNAIAGNNDPMDDDGHGSHVAGIIGAVGNNSTGIAGVAWKVQLMALKFLDSKGVGSDSDAISCIEFARQNGAHIINASWGDPSFSLSLYNAIARARDAGILFVAAAANDGLDTDLYPNYPSGYALDNIVSVGAVDHSGNIPSFSNYGAHSVHLMAPGYNIYSCWVTSDYQYATASGTSMATPYVAGILALLKATYPAEDHRQLIARLMANIKPLAAAQGKCSSGGMANLAAALQAEVVASWNASSYVGAAPMQVWMTNTSVGSISGSSWDFGDGTPNSTNAVATHYYVTPGHYTATLTVTNSSGQTFAASHEVAALDTYLAQATNYNWVETNNLSLVQFSTNIGAALPIPFPFVFYGITNTQLYVGTNGIIGFKDEDLNFRVNLNFPSLQTPHGIICPYWDDLGIAGGIYAGVLGEEPSRSMVISWVNAYTSQFPYAPLTFQVILSEGSPNILFQYLQVSPGSTQGGGQYATVGLEDDSGTVFTKYTYNGSPARLTNGQALLFTPKPPAYQPPTVSLTSPTNGGVYAVPATLVLTASATSIGSAITQVEFFMGTNSLGVATTAPYAVTASALPAGTYSMTARATDAQGASTTSSAVNITVELPPLVTLANPPDGARFTAPASINLNAYASDDDGMVENMEFWSGTNLLGVTPGNHITLIWSDIPAGTYTLYARAVDNLGLDTISPSITFTSIAPPTVTFTAPTNDSFFGAPSDVTLEARARSTGATVVQVEFFAGTNSLGIATNSPFVITVTNLATGPYNLSARATDDLGGVGSSRLIHIVIDQPPTVAILSPTNTARFSTLAAIPLEVAAGDSDGNVAYVEFYSGTSRLGIVTNSPFHLLANSLPAGIYEFNARAVDDLGRATVSSSIIITAIPPPMVAWIAPTNGTLLAAPADLVLEAAAASTDATVVQIEFFAGTNSLGIATNSPFTLLATNLSAGAYAFSARAMDDLGGIGISSNANIGIYQPPEVAILSPTNTARVSTMLPLTVQAAVADSNGIARVEFFSGTNLLGTVTNSPFNMLVNSSSAGIYTLTARAVDSLGFAAVSPSITITAIPPPEIVWSTPTNGTLLVAPADVTLEATALSEGAMVVQIEYFAGTNSWGVATNSPFALNVTHLTGGVYNLSARAMDDLGGIGISENGNIVVDEPPVVTLLSPTNTARFSTTAPLTLEAEAEDSDGIVANVVFYSGTNSLGSVSNSPFTLALAALPAGTYTLSASASDNWGVTSVSPSITITTVAPPSVSIIAPTNNSRFVAPANITLSASADTAGARITQVEFFNSQNTWGLISEPPYSLVMTNLPAGVYEIEARATDDLGQIGVSTPLAFQVETATPLRFESASYRKEGGFQCVISGLMDGISVTIQTSTDLVHWTSINTQLPAGTTVTFNDTNAIGASSRYYRLAR